MSAPFSSPPEPRKGPAEGYPVPPAVAAFLAEAPAAVSARVLGVSTSRVRQLRLAHRPRLSTASLLRWKTYLTQQNPLAGRWCLRRVRGGAVQFKGSSCVVLPVYAADGQLLAVALTRGGALLMQPLGISAACFVVQLSSAMKAV